MLLNGAVIDRFYTTTVTLNPGTTYAFKVKARNTVGASEFSQPVSILAAKVPDAPINLANLPLVTTAYQVGISWSQGAYNGGKSVIDYTVSFKNAASQGAFEQFSTVLTTTTATVTGLAPG